MSEVNFNEYKNIWVFAEQRDGKLMNVALELIGEGHNLSRDLGNDAKVAALIIGLLISAAVLAIAALWYFHIGPFALKEEPAQQTDQTIAATPTPVLPGLGSSSDTAFPDNSSEGSVSAPAGTPADASAPVVESAPAGESAPVNESVPAGESTSDAWDVW